MTRVLPSSNSRVIKKTGSGNYVGPVGAFRKPASTIPIAPVPLSLPSLHSEIVGRASSSTAPNNYTSKFSKNPHLTSLDQNGTHDPSETESSLSETNIRQDSAWAKCPVGSSNYSITSPDQPKCLSTTPSSSSESAISNHITTHLSNMATVSSLSSEPYESNSLSQIHPSRSLHHMPNRPSRNTNDIYNHPIMADEEFPALGTEPSLQANPLKNQSKLSSSHPINQMFPANSGLRNRNVRPPLYSSTSTSTSISSTRHEVRSNIYGSGAIANINYLEHQDRQEFSRTNDPNRSWRNTTNTVHNQASISPDVASIHLRTDLHPENRSTSGIVIRGNRSHYQGDDHDRNSDEHIGSSSNQPKVVNLSQSPSLKSEDATPILWQNIRGHSDGNPGVDLPAHHPTSIISKPPSIIPHPPVTSEIPLEQRTDVIKKSTKGDWVSLEEEEEEMGQENVHSIGYGHMPSNAFSQKSTKAPMESNKTFIRKVIDAHPIDNGKAKKTAISEKMGMGFKDVVMPNPQGHLIQNDTKPKLMSVGILPEKEIAPITKKSSSQSAAIMERNRAMINTKPNDRASHWDVSVNTKSLTKKVETKKVETKSSNLMNFNSDETLVLPANSWTRKPFYPNKTPPAFGNEELLVLIEKQPENMHRLALERTKLKQQEEIEMAQRRLMIKEMNLARLDSEHTSSSSSDQTQDPDYLKREQEKQKASLLSAKLMKESTEDMALKVKKIEEHFGPQHLVVPSSTTYVAPGSVKIARRPHETINPSSIHLSKFGPNNAFISNGNRIEKGSQESMNGSISKPTDESRSSSKREATDKKTSLPSSLSSWSTLKGIPSSSSSGFKVPTKPEKSKPISVSGHVSSTKAWKAKKQPLASDLVSNSISPNPITEIGHNASQPSDHVDTNTVNVVTSYSDHEKALPFVSSATVVDGSINAEISQTLTRVMTSPNNPSSSIDDTLLLSVPIDRAKSLLLFKPTDEMAANAPRESKTENQVASTLSDQPSLSTLTVSNPSKPWTPTVSPSSKAPYITLPPTSQHTWASFGSNPAPSFSFKEIMDAEESLKKNSTKLRTKRVEDSFNGQDEDHSNELSTKISTGPSKVSTKTPAGHSYMKRFIHHILALPSPNEKNASIATRTDKPIIPIQLPADQMVSPLANPKKINGRSIHAYYQNKEPRRRKQPRSTSISQGSLLTDSMPQMVQCQLRDETLNSVSNTVTFGQVISESSLVDNPSRAFSQTTYSSSSWKSKFHAQPLLTNIKPPGPPSHSRKCIPTSNLDYVAMNDKEDHLSIDFLTQASSHFNSNSTSVQHQSVVQKPSTQKEEILHPSKPFDKPSHNEEHLGSSGTRFSSHLSNNGSPHHTISDDTSTEKISPVRSKTNEPIFAPSRAELSTNWRSNKHPNLIYKNVRSSLNQSSSTSSTTLPNNGRKKKRLIPYKQHDEQEEGYASNISTKNSSTNLPVTNKDATSSSLPRKTKHYNQRKAIPNYQAKPRSHHDENDDLVNERQKVEPITEMKAMDIETVSLTPFYADATPISSLSTSSSNLEPNPRESKHEDREGRYEYADTNINLPLTELVHSFKSIQIKDDVSSSQMPTTKDESLATNDPSHVQKVIHSTRKQVYKVKLKSSSTNTSSNPQEANPIHLPKHSSQESAVEVSSLDGSQRRATISTNLRKNRDDHYISRKHSPSPCKSQPHSNPHSISYQNLLSNDVLQLPDNTPVDKTLETNFIANESIESTHLSTSKSKDHSSTNGNLNNSNHIDHPSLLPAVTSTGSVMDKNISSDLNARANPSHASRKTRKKQTLSIGLKTNDSSHPSINRSSHPYQPHHPMRSSAPTPHTHTQPSHNSRRQLDHIPNHNKSYSSTLNLSSTSTSNHYSCRNKIYRPVESLSAT